MKRIISFVLALTMILTFCACGAPGKLKPYLNGLQLGADATDLAEAQAQTQNIQQAYNERTQETQDLQDAYDDYINAQNRLGN